MSESNNVKFVEANGKWLWKRYDEQGSVIFRSPEFDTERQAREDYEANGGDTQVASQPEAPVQTQETGEATSTTAPAPEESNAAGNVAPEGEMTAGTASPDTDAQPGAEQAI